LEFLLNPLARGLFGIVVGSSTLACNPRGFHPGPRARLRRRNGVAFCAQAR
jgi:hypothetical protein